MNLRQKLLVSILVSAICVMALVYVISAAMVFQGFDRIEQSEMTAHMNRLQQSYTSIVENLKNRISDWAQWDDSYQFAQDLNTDFVSSNINVPTMESIHLNRMLFLNTLGDPVKELCYDSNLKKEMVCDDQLSAHFKGNSPLKHFDNLQQTHAGIMRLNEKQLSLISVRQIIKSDGSGPAAGILVFCRFVTDQIDHDIGKLIGFEVQGMDWASWSKDHKAMAGNLTLSNKRMDIYYSDPKLVNGFYLVDDLYGQSQWILQINIPRSVHEQALTTNFKSLAIFFGAMVLLFLILVYTIEQFFFKRISSLLQGLRSIDGKQFQGRLTITGSDEIAQAAQTINHILDEKDKQQIEAEGASRAKSEFLANMSHEIRTPMNAVFGFTEILLNTDVTTQQQGYLYTIKESGQVLLGLINDILDLSKIESGKLNFERIDFSLDHLLSSAVKMIRGRIKPDVDIVYVPDIQSPLYFQGDPTRIRQVVLNLLSNAAKFTEKGSITLTVKALENRQGWWDVDIVIKDTGIGISPDQLGVLFSAFTQVDASTTRKYGGTGLGLAISRKLARGMDGDIVVESILQAGSTFILKLPLTKANEPAQQEVYPVPVENIKGKTVMIVDDNEGNLKILNQFAKSFGMTVVSSVYGVDEAFAFLDQARPWPDVILSDIMMPGKDGYMFVSELQRRKEWPSVKVIAVSSDTNPGVAKKAQDAGFQAFLPKPIMRGELLMVLQSVFGDRRSSGQIITRHLSAEVLLKGKKVLMVDDHAVNLDLLSELLKIFGCSFERAVNGQEAVERVKNGNFDIVLMDIQMPVMGGIEATEALRKQGFNIPILALTAAAMKEDQEKAFHAGMNGFLTKPIQVNILREKLVEFLT